MNETPEMTILVVDDDDGHSELIRRNLRRLGVAGAILTFEDGQSALDYVLCAGPHAGRSENGHMVILLDIKMPGSIDGVEVLRRLKADPKKRLIPVIMLTTTDDAREIQRCYELGCSVYVTKPVDGAAFVEAVCRLGLFLSVASLPREEGAAM